MKQKVFSKHEKPVYSSLLHKIYCLFFTILSLCPLSAILGKIIEHGKFHHPRFEISIHNKYQ